MLSLLTEVQQKNLKEVLSQMAKSHVERFTCLHSPVTPLNPEKNQVEKTDQLIEYHFDGTEIEGGKVLRLSLSNASIELCISLMNHLYPQAKERRSFSARLTLNSRKSSAELETEIGGLFYRDVFDLSSTFFTKTAYIRCSTPEKYILKFQTSQDLLRSMVALSAQCRRSQAKELKLDIPNSIGSASWQEQFSGEEIPATIYIDRNSVYARNTLPDGSHIESPKVAVSELIHRISLSYGDGAVVLGAPTESASTH